MTWSPISGGAVLALLKYLLKNEPQSEVFNNGDLTGGAMEGMPGIPTP
jgi:hypothetical protein